LATALHISTGPIPQLDLSRLQDESLSEEEDTVLSYSEDPLNRLLDPELRESDSCSSFETLSVRDDSEGGKRVVAHRHSARKRQRKESPRELDSDVFASLSDGESERLPVRDSEWEELSENDPPTPRPQLRDLSAAAAVAPDERKHRLQARVYS
jgi:hypothetical protein